MQSFFLDFLPIILFFIAFKMYGIYIATVVGIAATGIQVLITRFFRKKFDKQQLVTFAVFVIFGGMTLYFHNPIFVKWKPSIIFWVFATAFFLSHFVGRKTLIQYMLSNLLVGQPPVPNYVWKRLNTAWFVFLALLGAFNLYVAYHFSTETWVNFKVFGILTLFIVFSVAQSLYLSRYLNLK